MRYAQPVDKLLVRASLPFQTFPVSQNEAKQTRTGDFNIFAVYTFDTGNSNVSAEIGPLLVTPPASPTLLGAGKWQRLPLTETLFQDLRKLILYKSARASHPPLIFLRHLYQKKFHHIQ